MWVIRAEKVSKCFRIYRKPSDRLKELLTFGKRRFHEPFWAVKDVDLEVEQGRCLGIIGENGSGKSTLLRMIAGVNRPTSGTIAVNGRISALLELGAGFNPQFTGRENIFINASILGFSDAQTRRRIPDIERFAEIGEFIDRPVKTYSSGMFVRLAFAVAIHMEPDVLIIDEALSVGDVFFQQRCMRRIQQIKRAGVTIVFVSHDVDAVRNLAESSIWMEHGRVALEGKTDEVVAKYLSAMVNRGRKNLMMEEAIGNALPISANLELTDEARSRIPKFISHVSNIDHRHGNGKALVRGIGVFSREGYPATAIVQGDRICVRISVDFLEECSKPNVGFIVRNRLGEDVTGTNATFEGLQLPPVRAGDRISVDFVLDLPLLQQGFYYFSPAVADGMLDQYDICDWIDNACAVEIMQKTTTYGYMRVPTKVSAFAVTGENSHFEIEQISSNPDETKKQLGLTSRLSH